MKNAKHVSLSLSLSLYLAVLNVEYELTGEKVTDKRSMGTLVYWGWFLLNKNSGTTYILGEK